MTITATFAIGKVQTSPKGAKSVWQSEWTSVLWEPSSEDRVCFAMERDSEAWAAWDDFEKRCVGAMGRQEREGQVAKLPQGVASGNDLPEVQAGLVQCALLGR